MANPENQKLTQAIIDYQIFDLWGQSEEILHRKMLLDLNNADLQGFHKNLLVGEALGMNVEKWALHIVSIFSLLSVPVKGLSYSRKISYIYAIFKYTTI